MADGLSIYTLIKKRNKDKEGKIYLFQGWLLVGGGVSIRKG
jgi:hypothetical protein